jgi:hypothetical protein
MMKRIGNRSLCGSKGSLCGYGESPGGFGDFHGGFPGHPHVVWCVFVDNFHVW